MMQRDDFENRLGQGLKRWANDGKPTLDLEAYVLGKQGGAQQAAPPAVRAPRRRWMRWLGSVAAAAAVIFTLGFTFPSWAGAAAGWPLLGPVVKEIIMKDAGLQWAYEAGLLQQPLAEVKDGDVSVKILAVLADNFRTTVIYQANGLNEWDRGEMVQVHDGSLFSRLAHTAGIEPVVSITGVEGQLGVYTSYAVPVATPLGVFGTVSTVPLVPESGTLGLVVRIKGKEYPVELMVSRAETSQFSREVAIGQSQRFGDVTVTVASVIYTPAETVLKYTVEKPRYSGGWGHGNEGWMTHLLVGSKRVTSSNTWHSPDGYIYQTFPAVESKGMKLVIPIEVMGQESDLVWKLERDAVQEAAGTTITLARVERQGNQIALEWRYLPQGQYMGFDGLELLDAAGNSYPARAGRSSWTSGDRLSEETKSVMLTLPEGVELVAIRAKEIAVRVEGPWVFELPRP